MRAPGGQPDAIEWLLPAPTDGLVVEPHLAAIEAQAVEADRTRCLDREMVEGLRGSDVMRLSADRSLGGLAAGVGAIGRELEAVAARCASTAWCLWNHLCVFHLFAGALGPDHADRLADIVAAGRWVSFPAGAGSGVRARVAGDRATLDGVAAFGTGARYGDHCGVVFAVLGDDGRIRRDGDGPDLRFTIVDTAGTATDGDDVADSGRRGRVEIRPTWDGAGLRASATDDVAYDGVDVALSDCTRWYGANRAESLRTVPVIDHRYREDWVGLSDLWLGWMAVGVVRECLRIAVDGIGGRRVLMGSRMIERPTVQINLGRAVALCCSARAAVTEAGAEVDRRIEAGIVPDQADYFRQQAIVTMAVDQLAEAVDLLVTTLGGNGLREGADVERRIRDFRAMPLHINVHQDRISHQLGRLALGIELDPF